MEMLNRKNLVTARCKRYIVVCRGWVAWLLLVTATLLLAPVGVFATTVETDVLATHDFLIGSHDDSPDDHSPHLSFADPSDLTVVVQIDYFVHDHGGADALTANHLARIEDAAEVWNDAGANLFLNEVVSDATDQMHVHNDSTSGCSGSAIGCAEYSWFSHDSDTYEDGHLSHSMASELTGDISELTMITSLNWYTGETTGIGSIQLDYMTVVIQEFGHLLGLGHNGNDSSGHGTTEEALSPMNGLLSSGTTNRILQSGDLDAIRHLYGAAPVPEPATMTLLGLGLAGLAYRRRKSA